jgi:hypothetical protein
MAQTTEYQISLHYMDTEGTGANDTCPYMMLQTRPLNFETLHVKRLSKLILRGEIRSFNDEYLPILIYGSNYPNNWDLLAYETALDGQDMFNTRIMGNYKYFIVVFAAGKDTIIQQLDTVFTERFTQTLR